jgi:hypothetical protein
MTRFGEGGTIAHTGPFNVAISPILDGSFNLPTGPQSPRNTSSPSPKWGAMATWSGLGPPLIMAWMANTEEHRTKNTRGIEPQDGVAQQLYRAVGCFR